MILTPAAAWLFFIISCFLARYAHFALVVKVLAVLAGIDCINILKTNSIQLLSTKLKCMANVVLVISIAQWWSSNQGIDLTTVPSWLTATTVVVCILNFVAQCITYKKGNYNNALRSIAFLLATNIGIVVFVELLVELQRVLVVYSLPQSTQSQDTCTSVTKSTNGIIFTKNTNFLECPTQLWRLMRTNFIFLSQTYILYTLTTALRESIKQNPAQSFMIGAIAVIESFAVAGAAILQFDVIANCHILSDWTFALIVAALTAHMLRKLLTTEAHDYSRNLMDLVGTVKSNSLNYIKLKL